VRNGALRFRPPAGQGSGAAAAATGARGGARVFVLQPDGTLRRVADQTGTADDQYTEVVSGLKEGDPVVVGIRREEEGVSSSGGRPPSFAPARRGFH
jgi:multidrug efflux pump subunit AcrA (membrane-fusion protein)